MDRVYLTLLDNSGASTTYAIDTDGRYQTAQRDGGSTLATVPLGDALIDFLRNRHIIA